MKTISRSFLNFIRHHKVWSVIISLIIVGIVYYVFFGGKGQVAPTFVLVEKGNVKEEVSVTGNVKPLSDVTLAFERGGRVDKINVSVGDKVYTGQILASISNSDLSASLDQARANLKIAEVQLGQVKVGNTGQKVIVQNPNVDKAELDLAQNKISVISAIKDSYTSADDAVRNKMYSLFTDPGRYMANLSFTTDAFLQSYIEEGKDTMSDRLVAWYQSLINMGPSSDLESYYNDAKSNLVSIKTLLDKCAEAVNRLSPESAYTTQTQIDTWKANVSLARASIDLAISNLVGKFNLYQAAILALSTAQNNYTVQEVNVEQAQAGVASAEAELAKTIIKSPTDGIVTNINPKLGEIVPANQAVISVISYGEYEVEAYVPEADIAKIKIGDLASTTLDAYGESVNFDTVVTKVNPAATVIEGVPTYKVTLKFISKDNRIRSGMTVNLDVLTAERTAVLIVPTRAVYSKNNERYVRVLEEDGRVQEIRVLAGLRGSDGNIEVLAGLNEGDKVITSL